MESLTREQSLAIANKGVGFHQNPFKSTLHSQAVLKNLPLGYANASDDIHHIFGVQDHMRMFIQGLNEREQENMLRQMNHRGIRFGNDPINLISLPRPDHRQVHQVQESMGIDAKNKKDILNILERVSTLPYNERVKALDIYSDYFYPGIVEELHKLGHKVPTQAENKIRFQKEIAQEALEERMEHIKEVRKAIEAQPVINEKTGRRIRNTDQKIIEFIKRVDNLPSYKDVIAGPAALNKARARRAQQGLLAA